MNTFTKKIIATLCCGVIIGTVVIVLKNNDTAAKNNDTAAVIPITTISSDYRYYKSLKEMTDSSNLVVYGVIIHDNGISLIDAGASEMPYRTYDFKVKRGIKGKAVEDDVISFKVLETTESIDSSLVEDNEYICFLQTYDNGILASLINIEQSTILINGDDLLVTEPQKDIIEGVLDK